jgi:hypothetical protein
VQNGYGVITCVVVPLNPQIAVRRLGLSNEGRSPKSGHRMVAKGMGFS